ncbi:MAG: RecQ family ATP-dependent DNA helicase [Bacteroidia bacterium]|jgi:ATP-dependent DNA helicase RecQ|nr:RecQ family ATP-dependent DNA helicase [Bacteroidia bacterium]
MQDIYSILRQYWGHENFRPLQEDIIRSVMEGKDTLALLPTGGGKSVCFQVPALAMEGICVVVSPLIALMQDQVENLKRRGIKAIAITSAMRKREIDVAFDNCVYGKIKFLYVSPERLQTEIARVRISRMNVNLLAVDEAHCISQWGYDFRPPYLQIADLRELLPDVPVMALTATATNEVVADIAKQLEFKPGHRIIKGSFARSNLSYVLRETDDKPTRLLRMLQQVPGCSVVYVRSRRRTQEIAAFLQQQGIPATFYHAGLTPQQRTERQQLWLSDKVRVMVATNAFGMGIDKPDVRTVAHLDLPDSPEAYFQEAGRGGRDGQPAFATLFWHKRDLDELQEHLEAAFPPLDEIKRTYQALANLYEVPVGAGEGLTVIFDQQKLCDTYKLDKVTVFNSLKFLEREGYIAVSEAIFQPPRVMITTSRENLYRFEVANASYEPFIKLLLRSYSGLFDQYTRISEFDLAKRLGRPVRDVVQWLNELQKHDLLNYIPQNDQPLLTFISQRVDAKHLYISPQHLRERRLAAEKRVKAMQEFALGNTHCRQSTLLHYFGETKTEDCGKCDVCRATKASENTENIAGKITRLLQQPQAPEQVIQAFPENQQKQVIETIREMADSGLISFQGDLLVINAG